MRIAIVYESWRGTTRAAAGGICAILEREGHHCTVEPVATADPGRIVEADLLCIGTWVQGLFLVGQRPTRGVMRFIDHLEKLDGRRAIAFCTYKLSHGGTLDRMGAALESRGASVIGHFAFRGARPSRDFAAFARDLR